jgi:hypothetical protein
MRLLDGWQVSDRRVLLYSPARDITLSLSDKSMTYIDGRIDKYDPNTFQWIESGGWSPNSRNPFWIGKF